MNIICSVFGHAYVPLPLEPGVQYINCGSTRVFGPEKCTRCGAQHAGLKIPPMPPALRQRFEQAAARTRFKHLKEKLRTTRRATDARRAM